MRVHLLRASRGLAAALAPVLVVQGLRLRRRIPVLPEAAGERTGTVVGTAGVEDLAILVLGESTAAGVGVSRQTEGLAPAIARGLSSGRGRQVSWQVVARSGCTARAALTDLVPRLRGESFDLVVVVLGVNDVLTMRSGRSWQRQVAALVTVLRGRLRPGGRIVLTGIPDLGGFPALPRPIRSVLALHSRALDLGLARLAHSRPGIVHVPAPLLDNGSAEAGALYAVDGFHPGAEGYRRWAEHLVRAVTDDGGPPMPAGPDGG